MHKHCRWFHWFTFLPYFLVDWVGRFVFLSVVRWDRPAAVLTELARGAADYVRMAGGGRPLWGEPK
jgi:hypothetical protein